MQSWNSKFKILSFTLWFFAFSFSLLAFRGATCVFAEESEGVGASAAKPNSVPAPVAGDPNVQTSLEVSAVNAVRNAPAQISNGANTTDASDSLPLTWQIERICSAIYQGDFAGARELLCGPTQSKSIPIDNIWLPQLLDIISEYEAIDEKRQSGR